MLTCHSSTNRLRRRVSSDPACGSAVAWETTDCLLCGGDDLELLLRTDVACYGRRVEVGVVRCRGCQLVFTSPRPTAASMPLFYPPDYAPHELRVRKHGWDRQVKQWLERAVLRSRFGYRPQPASRATHVVAAIGRLCLRGGRRRETWFEYRGSGRLLDFGCGAGELVCQMRERGWSVEGVDLSPAVARKVERSLGIRVHVGSLPHRDLAAASFDVITMWNALEHVHEPRAVLRAARELLRPGGRLVIGVPNLASWSARRFGAAWFGLDLPRHLVHFTPETLRAMLEGEQFRVLDQMQIGRDGWLRHSAERAAARGGDRAVGTFCRCKSLARLLAAWTERAGQADFMRVIAARRND